MMGIADRRYSLGQANPDTLNKSEFESVDRKGLTPFDPMAIAPIENLRALLHCAAAHPAHPK
ncbi:MULTISPECIES: hypothetical protein [Methylobacterium]|uniref:hypothetical protein n=1 Tax=Methylobacterium TaxID=407 RepID=UPI0012E7DE86|nr:MULTISPECIES: hypothetical protein [Methylobacterium]MCI9881918.1 hypothetical protein [Methylobacterium goesingense]